MVRVPGAVGMVQQPGDSVLTFPSTGPEEGPRGPGDRGSGGVELTLARGRMPSVV